MFAGPDCRGLGKECAGLRARIAAPIRSGATASESAPARIGGCGAFDGDAADGHQRLARARASLRKQVQADNGIGAFLGGGGKTGPKAM